MMARTSKRKGEDRQAKVALVAGATGLVGRELVRLLLSAAQSEWSMVYAVARKLPDGCGARHRHVQCDLLDRQDAMEKLAPLAGCITHMFWVTWASQFPLDTAECCCQNRAMLSNALDALCSRGGGGAAALAHLSLQTGTKHYVSLKNLATSHGYYEEDSPRVVDGDEAHNFYYALEDLVKKRLSGSGSRISWSVHRPGLVLGVSRRSHFNIMGSLCVYGSICRYLGLPFLFVGQRRCWEEPYMDASDARLVAGQHVWWAAKTSSSATDQLMQSQNAFNAVNGTAFTWKEVWPALAGRFGLESATRFLSSSEEESSSFCYHYTGVMRDKGGVWEEIVKKEGLRRSRMEELANWGFLDTMFQFPGKILVSPAKARRLGFTVTYDAVDSFLYWVDRMREDRLIP